MVHTLMMNSQLKRQQQQQQQTRQVNKCGTKPNERGAAATSSAAAIIYSVGGGAVSSAKVLAKSCFRRRFKVATFCNGSGGICLWLVLLVFMLILCGNTVISQQQQQRNINPSHNNHNNNGNQNNSSIGNTNNNSNIGNRSGNISLQISTPSSNNEAAAGNDATANSAKTGTSSVDVVEVATDGAAKQRGNIVQSLTTATNTNATTNGNSGNTNASSSKDGESGGVKTNAFTNDAAPPANGGRDDGDHNDDDDDLRADDDLDNSSELLNESEDGYEHSSISPTTYRPTRTSIAPQLTSAQERERRLMNVLAARRSALHRPGFRNRIGTTGRTATAVETTSKSPTDPRSICIRNCTKNFTRRTTASCMRQCANFSRVANQSNSNVPGSTMAGNIVMVKNSSKTGTGTALAGEKDTNEILFTDESSHGLLVIAKEQNDTVNHITDENKGNGSVVKLRGRRKPNGNTVTVATTSIEDDEIQPYLYFGQKLPPLKPNALTITSVSDEHPKLLEVSVADASTTSSTTTPVSTTASSSTLSAVEKSRSRFKYSMRGGVSFNRRYTTLNRGTTAEVPTDVRTTTLRIVTENPKSQEVRDKPEKVDDMQQTLVKSLPIPLESLNREALKEEAIVTATPLIITVLSDEEMMAPGSTPTPTPKLEVIDTTTATSSTTTTSATTTTSTTTTTTTPPPATTTIRSTTIAATQVPKTTPRTTTSTTTTTTTTTTIPTPITTSSTTTFATPVSTTPTTTTTTTTTRKSNIIEEDKELLRSLGPSLTQHINTEDGSNLIIFVNHTSRPYQGTFRHSTTTTTAKPLHQLPGESNESDTILSSTLLTPVQSSPKPKTKDTTYSSTTTPLPQRENTQKAPDSTTTTSQPQVTGEISSTVVTDDQEISLEMQRMNIVTMVLAGIGIIPLLAIILYLLRNYLLKRPIKDEEDFDVCITDQQPISPVKKLDAKYKEEAEDEVDHHKKLPQRQHSLHSKLVAPPLARDNNHNHQMTQKRYDDKSSITSDQEFERSNIRLKSLLGEGNFGQVWKAEADDLSGHFGATRIVAVKTIKACSTQLSLKDEANMMRKLGSHQNVVTLLGACVETEPHMLIMEYAMRGRLLSLLRAARNATNILPASVPGGRSLTPLSPRTLAGFCLDIARGMEYISEKRIVHRDLAARNVLLDHNGVCKICDFGMSIDLDAERKRKEQEKNCANEIMRSNFNKFKFDFGGKFIMNHWSATGSPHKDGCSEKKSHGQDTIGKRPALPIRWMAPESLQYNIFSTETDIWAFGIVLWEIATLGSTPYSQLTGREVIRRVPQGLRPDLPKEGRHEFYNLMSRCWHKDPNMRPSFNQCRLEISRSLHKWVDDDSAASDYMDVSGFSEDLEQGMVYFNHRISEFECEI